MASDKKHSPELERALTRQNAGFAVHDLSELTHLIHLARCAAERLKPKPEEVRDVLAALVIALETNDQPSLEALAKPALKQLVKAHEAAEKLFESGDGGWPVGFDSSQPQYRAHGRMQAYGAHLLNVVRIYPRGSARNHNEGEQGKLLAAHFADCMSVGMAVGEFAEKYGQVELRKRVLELFPLGPTDDESADAATLGEAFGMTRKQARNAVEDALRAEEEKSSTV